MTVVIDAEKGWCVLLNEHFPPTAESGKKTLTKIRREVRRIALKVPVLGPRARARSEELIKLRQAYERSLAEAEELRTRLRRDREQSVAEAEELRTRLRHDHEQSVAEAEDYKRSLAEAEETRTRLRHDYERSVAHAEDLRTRLRDSELRREQSEQLAELKVQHYADLEARYAASEALWRADLESRSARPAATAADIENSQARLLGGLAMMTAEMATLRRLFASEKSDAGAESVFRLRSLYLDLLEDAVSGRLFEDPSITPGFVGVYDPQVRMIGRDWPARAPTMIGIARLRNIRALAEAIIENGIEGDFLEAGVWRGGACIYMRGILAAHGIRDRKVFVADSFAGLPPPKPDLYPADLGDRHHEQAELVVPLEEVEKNFAKFGLLDEQVVFLPGWFKDTLPSAPVERLALLRLDGDMYGSTMETLNALYSKVTLGGYVIIDDFILGPCRKAVEDFRSAIGCSDQICEVDGAAVFWQKTTN